MFSRWALLGSAPPLISLDSDMIFPISTPHYSPQGCQCVNCLPAYCTLSHCHTATLRLLQKLKSFPQSQDVTHSNSLLGNEKFPILPSCHWPPAGTVLPGQRTLCKYQNINKANRRVKSPIELEKRYRINRFIPPQFGPLKQNNLIERVTELHPIKQSRLVLLLYFLYFL